jgi:endonuclease/exonuclease/phosphatase family metal-dependent hydrolase
LPLSPRRRALLPALALVALLAPAAAAPAKNPDVTVMTRNIYLGADLTPIIAAATDPNPFAVPTAAGVAFSHVVANNFPARAQAIAAEVAAQHPDLIGLQEVSTYYFGAFNDPAQATTPVLDFLTILQGALAAAGQSYTVVSTPNVESDQEVPAFLGANPATWRDIRLVTSNAILARTGVAVSNPQGGTFANQVTVLGQPSMRNWQTVDVTAGGKSFRFLNPHLEAFSGNEAVRTAEAKELAAGPLRATVPIVAVGDFNSDPGTSTGGAYAVLTSPSQGKLRDAWTAAQPGVAGLTCCRAELLSVANAPFDQRLDLVLSVPQVKAQSAELVGLTQVGGLYPSDHAGLAATLRVP